MTTPLEYQLMWFNCAFNYSNCYFCPNGWSTPCLRCIIGTLPIKLVAIPCSHVQVSSHIWHHLYIRNCQHRCSRVRIDKIRWWYFHMESLWCQSCLIRYDKNKMILFPYGIPGINHLSYIIRYAWWLKWKNIFNVSMIAFLTWFYQ